MGAITQVRVLGGVVGIAVAQVVLSSTIRADLPSFLTPEQVEAILESAASISKLEPEQIREVQRVYGGAFNKQTRMVMYFAVASLAVACFAFRRRPRSFADVDKGDVDKGEEERTGEERGHEERATDWSADDITLVRASVARSSVVRSSVHAPRLSLHIGPDSFAEQCFKV